MNTCQNCQNEFEKQPGSIQVCPLCGEPVELDFDSDEISDEATIDIDNDLEQPEPSLAKPSSSNEDHFDDEPTFEIDDEEEEIFAIDDDEEEVFEIDDDEEELIEIGDDESADTYIGSQDTDHQDDLFLPKIPISKDDKQTESIGSTPSASTDHQSSDADESEQQTENIDEAAEFALTEVATEMLTETGFANTEEATEYFDPDEKQPTIELESAALAATSLDYAEREIIGLSAEDQPSEDADYVISMKERDSELGSGASGIVYKATQKSLNRTVAIKLLKKQIKAGTQSQSRRTTPKQKDIEKFLYESQITAGLDHPNVITVHDLGVTSNNTLFYSMKLFEGGKDWSKDFDKNTLEENLNIFNDVCDAMRRAHRDRIIHRDLKPQNVLVGDFGEVQVTDWGLAIDLKDNDSQLSGGGTPCYMAPEMASHYLAQQELRALNSKLTWTRENAPNSADEISILKEKITDIQDQESFYREQIGELSDVYVLGAILFQIASGYPPHLFQLNETHRKQWGSETGKNKVRRELQMAAEGKFANYLVRDLPNPEAREALRDIALKAMEQKLAERYENVAVLQQVVRDFRDFMRCIEDTQRGNREVEAANENMKSYVNLNNAMYAYEGALENYPNYDPANAGLAKARFLFAERALKNQDFELGLSTLSDEAIDHQPDKELASRLRNELTTQRDRRDRRKKLLFFATMASLISIGVGIMFGAYAFWAANQASEALASARKNKQELKTGLEDLLQTQKDSIELQVQSALDKFETNTLKQESSVSQMKTKLAQIDTKIQSYESQFGNKKSELSQEIANFEKQIAEVGTNKAKIDAELIKESTQYNQYKDYLREIERNIDEDISKTRIRELFNSKDISLPVKNAWEIHHLYKQTNPATAAIGEQQIGQLATLKTSRDGTTMVALTVDGQVFRINGESAEFESIVSPRLKRSSAVSLDLSEDGKWLAVALESVNDDAAKTIQALPLIINLQTGNEFTFSNSMVDKLRFVSKKPETEDVCREKFYCRPKHVEFMKASDTGFSLFMVDQRVQLGLNQIRCSVLDVNASNSKLNGAVRKAKLPGQLFLTNPGQLIETGCLASATMNPDGTVVAAVIASHPEYGINVVSIDAADKMLKDESNLSDSKFNERYFAGIEVQKIELNRIANSFAPTAIKLLPGQGNQHQLLVGNGKGELANLKIGTRSNAMTLVASSVQMLNSNSIGPSSSIIDARSKTSHTVATHGVTSKTSPLFASTHQQNESSRLPAHKSIVREITFTQGQVVSTSESEILIWDQSAERIVAAKKLFGQSGKIASVAAANNNNQLQLVTVSNLAGNLTEMRRWNPESTQHDAMIQLDNFKNLQQTAKKIVCGAADKKSGSQSIAMGFDDGTLEYFNPKSGTVKFARPADTGLKLGQNAMSRLDFNSGKFKYVDERQQLLMYTNSLGLVSWNLGDMTQTDPLRMAKAEKLFNGPSENTSVFFSADDDGNNLVTSHPRFRDRFLLWQHTQGDDYAVTEIGPFKKSGTGSLSGLNILAQPIISPNGKVMACVLRLRNTFEVQILRTSPSRNLQKLKVIRGDARTNFRSLHFVSDDKIVITQDRVDQGVKRNTSLIRLKNDGDKWLDKRGKLPRSLTSMFNQITIADVAVVDRDLHFVGFGIRDNSEPGNQSETGNQRETECDTASGERGLLVWNSDGLIFDRAIPFSRRIAPRFVDQELQYFVASTSNRPGSIRFESPTALVVEEMPDMVVDNAGRPAKSWHNVGSKKLVVSGTDWFALMNPENKQPTEFVFSRNNSPKQIELAGEKMLVQHLDNSASFLDVKSKQSSRLKGTHRAIALSQSSKYVALASQTEDKINIFAAGKITDKPNAEIESNAICMTWLNKDALMRIKIAKADWPEEILATAKLEAKHASLEFWGADGKRLELPKKYSMLPLRENRAGQKVKSFSISRVTAKLVSIVWDTAEEDRADIWRFAKNDKADPTKPNKNIASQWFLVDDSGVGQIESVAFSEVATGQGDVAEKIAPRIVISADNEGSKFVSLFALELGLDFRTKPLLDLYVTDKLQKVDQIIGADFSGDGKTLLAMTSDRAQVRLTDGWQIAKVDADYDDRIREFNLQSQGGTIAQLKKKRGDAVANLTNLEEPEALGTERENKAKQSKELQEAAADLAIMQNKLENERESIRAEETKKVQDKIDKIEQQLKEIKTELNADQ